MKAFEDITLDWDGETRVIAANRVLGAIARIEEVITIYELQSCAQAGTLPVARLAQAYGAVLRYAGARVTDEEVYVGMFTDASEVSNVHAACDALLVMMVPPGVIDRIGEGEDEAPGKPPKKPVKKPPKKPVKKPGATSGAKRTAREPSRKSTRRRSGTTAG